MARMVVAVKVLVMLAMPKSISFVTDCPGCEIPDVPVQSVLSGSIVAAEMPFRLLLEIMLSSSVWRAWAVALDICA